jgi:hypothetical protein
MTQTSTASPTPPPAPPAPPARPPTPPAEPETFQPVAAVLAALVPGAGHVFLGETRRGVLIGVGVLSMFLGGMLIGGIGVVDRRENFIWFLGQAMVGPLAFGVDYVHQTQFKIQTAGNGARIAEPDEGRDPGTGRSVRGVAPPYERSLGRVHELGTLFATIAGMMNLICVIDALYHAPRRRVARGDAGSAAR